ncbi:MAG: hypothetical protein NVSMB39_2810 [Candidatus Saccharimonadales bacterium]
MNGFVTRVSKRVVPQLVVGLKRAMRPEPEHDFPVFDSEEWTVGWKVANLAIDRRTGAIGFISTYRRAQFYGIDEQAICMRSSLHIAPGEKCECGFHAFGPNSLATVQGFMAKTGQNIRGVKNLVLLWVGLAGWTLEGKTFETGERAARAQRQRVGKVHVPISCNVAGCKGNAIRLGVLCEAPVSSELRRYDFLRPLCSDHQPPITITLGQCSDRLSVPVVWLDPALA